MDSAELEALAVEHEGKAADWEARAWPSMATRERARAQALRLLKLVQARAATEPPPDTTLFSLLRESEPKPSREPPLDLRALGDADLLRESERKHE